MRGYIRDAIEFGTEKARSFIDANPDEALIRYIELRIEKEFDGGLSEEQIAEMVYYELERHRLPKS